MSLPAKTSPQQEFPRRVGRFSWRRSTITVIIKKPQFEEAPGPVVALIAVSPLHQPVRDLIGYRTSPRPSFVVVKTLSEGIKLGASIFLDMIPNASGPDEGQPFWIVFMHRVQKVMDNCDLLVGA